MLDETDIKDKHGHVIIEPGLKVRHKESQFEYTVDDVLQDDSDNITIILKLPEVPRFTPPADDPESVITDTPIKDAMLQEIDPPEVYFEPEDGSTFDVEDGTLIAVPQKEFEKEYEVK